LPGQEATHGEAQETRGDIAFVAEKASPSETPLRCKTADDREAPCNVKTTDNREASDRHQTSSACETATDH
jgi:hypothetical protein